MSTLDVVAQAGGSPANFLDAGGGSNAEKIRQAVELLLANDAVKAVLFNIFGGITRGDEVARSDRGLRRGQTGRPVRGAPGRDQRRRGRRLLAEAALPNVYPAKTMNEAAEMVVALAAGRGGSERLMAVLVDE
jgi:succinyl-CoA synthetase beta subunit